MKGEIMIEQIIQLKAEIFLAAVMYLSCTAIFIFSINGFKKLTSEEKQIRAGLFLGVLFWAVFFTVGIYQEIIANIPLQAGF
jgi:diacylglycerol kinase